jgi:hypothetical protein
MVSAANESNKIICNIRVRIGTPCVHWCTEIQEHKNRAEINLLERKSLGILAWKWIQRGHLLTNKIKS